MSFDNADAVLAHHGVKGMKWGVRKQRATVSSSPKPKGHDDYNHAHSDIANMTLSNKELQRRVNRLNLEKQYNDLTSKKQSKYTKKLGEKYAENFANITMKIAGAAASAAFAFAFKAILDKAISGGLDASTADKIRKGVAAAGKVLK